LDTDHTADLGQWSRRHAAGGTPAGRGDPHPTRPADVPTKVSTSNASVDARSGLPELPSCRALDERLPLAVVEQEWSAARVLGVTHGDSSYDACHLDAVVRVAVAGLAPRHVGQVQVVQDVLHRLSFFSGLITGASAPARNGPRDRSDYSGCVPLRRRFVRRLRAPGEWPRRIMSSTSRASSASTSPARSARHSASIAASWSALNSLRTARRRSNIAAR